MVGPTGYYLVYRRTIMPKSKFSADEQAEIKRIMKKEGVVRRR
jgi:hypothetical protein